MPETEALVSTSRSVGRHALESPMTDFRVDTTETGDHSFRVALAGEVDTEDRKSVV